MFLLLRYHKKGGDKKGGVGKMCGGSRRVVISRGLFFQCTCIHTERRGVKSSVTSED